MKAILGIFLGVLVAGVSNGALTHVESFKSHLLGLMSSGNTLKTCLTKVTHPLGEASKFAHDVQTIEDLIHKLEGRLSSTVNIIHAVMLIPYVGAFASPVLGPASTVLNTINSGLKTVTHEIDAVVKVIRGWLSPLVVVQHEVATLNTKISQVIAVIAKAESETQKVESCIQALPAGSARTHAESAIDHVASTLDHIPSALLSPVSHVTSGCTQVEHFLSKLHLVRRKRGLPSLSKVISVLQKIDGAFGPLGHFLDEVNKALSKKICLLGELIKIGKEVVKGVEHVGKEIVSGTEHVVHEVSHTISNVGHSISHAFHHIFGRRGIDGRYYIIVDKDFDTKKRGIDLCFSINDALKAVNGVTGGILSEAQKFIGKLFHGHLPFHIPGLTSDILNLGGLLKQFHIGFPSVGTLLKLSESAVTQALHLNPLTQYIQAVPVCKAVLVGR